MDTKAYPIEGVGSEVLAGLTIIGALAITLATWWKFWYTRDSLQTIHPENVDLVAGTRQHLQQAQINRRMSNDRLAAGGSLPNGIGVPVSDDDVSSNIGGPPVHTQSCPAVPDRTAVQQQLALRSSSLVLRARRVDRDFNCPICLQDAKFAIETNCGHLFCGGCIVLYWQHGSWPGPVRCPVCRQQVTILLPSFTDPEINSVENEDIEEKVNIIREITQYNRRFSGEPRPLLDYIRDLPTLLRHLWNEFFSVGGLMYMFRIRIVLCFCAAVMYLISPLDIIPEAAFGILGLFDDIFVVLLLAIYVSIIYRRFVVNRGFT